jgi:hypothetical protein
VTHTGSKNDIVSWWIRRGEAMGEPKDHIRPDKKERPFPMLHSGYYSSSSAVKALILYSKTNPKIGESTEGFLKIITTETEGANLFEIVLTHDNDEASYPYMKKLLNNHIQDSFISNGEQTFGGNSISMADSTDSTAFSSRTNYGIHESPEMQAISSNPF